MNSKKDSYKDHSRFTRWVNNLDNQDRILKPIARKRKWAFILGFILVIFALSFIMFPSVSLKSEKITPIGNKEIQKPGKDTQSAFELPVDSFENQLKQLIDEGAIKKE